MKFTQAAPHLLELSRICKTVILSTTQYYSSPCKQLSQVDPFSLIQQGFANFQNKLLPLMALDDKKMLLEFVSDGKKAVVQVLESQELSIAASLKEHKEKVQAKYQNLLLQKDKLILSLESSVKKSTTVSPAKRSPKLSPSIKGSRKKSQPAEIKLFKVNEQNQNEKRLAEELQKVKAQLKTLKNRPSDEEMREQLKKKIKSMELQYNKRLKMAEQDVYQKLRPQIQRKDRKIKQLQGELSESKSQHVSEVGVWSQRLKKTKQDCSLQINRAEQSHSSALLRMKEEMLADRDQGSTLLKAEYQQKYNQAKNNYDKTVGQMNNRHRCQKQEMEKRHAQMLGKLQNSTKDRIAQNVRLCERRVAELTKQKTSLEAQVKSAVEELRSKKVQFYDKNYRFQLQRQSLKQQVRAKSEENNQLCQRVAGLQQKYAELQQQGRNERARVKAEHQAQLSKVGSDFQRRVQDIKQNHLQFYKSIQDNLNRMQELKASEIASYLEQMEGVKAVYFESESRYKEDARKIKELGRDCQRAVRENRALKEEVKQLRLQLQNKEKNYCKIFTNQCIEDSEREKELKAQIVRKGAQSVILPSKGKSKSRSLMSGRQGSNNALGLPGCGQVLNPMITALGALRQLNQNIRNRE